MAFLYLAIPRIRFIFPLKYLPWFLVAWCKIMLTILFHYRPKRSFGQGYIFTPVCHSFCSQGGCGHLTSRPPQTRPPLGPDLPRDQTSPGTRPPWTRPPWDQTSPGTRPPGPDPPDQTRHPPEKQTLEYGRRSAGTHPTGMHSCFRLRFRCI